MQEESILGEIPSYTFGNKIIVSLDARWKDYFNSKEPITFKAVIQNGKYVLVGPGFKLTLGPTSNPLLNEVDNSE